MKERKKLTAKKSVFRVQFKNTMTILNHFDIEKKVAFVMYLSNHQGTPRQVLVLAKKRIQGKHTRKSLTEQIYVNKR
jgi:hypothetical protein